MQVLLVIRLSLDSFAQQQHLLPPCQHRTAQTMRSVCLNEAKADQSEELEQHLRLLAKKKLDAA